MRATVMHKAHDVTIENIPDANIQQVQYRHWHGGYRGGGWRHVGPHARAPARAAGPPGHVVRGRAVAGRARERVEPPGDGVLTTTIAGVRPGSRDKRGK